MDRNASKYSTQTREISQKSFQIPSKIHQIAQNVCKSSPKYTRLARMLPNVPPKIHETEQKCPQASPSPRNHTVCIHISPPKNPLESPQMFQTCPEIHKITQSTFKHRPDVHETAQKCPQTSPKSIRSPQTLNLPPNRLADHPQIHDIPEAVAFKLGVSHRPNWAHRKKDPISSLFSSPLLPTPQPLRALHPHL